MGEPLQVKKGYILNGLFLVKNGYFLLKMVLFTVWNGCSTSLQGLYNNLLQVLYKKDKFILTNHIVHQISYFR